MAAVIPVAAPMVRAVGQVDGVAWVRVRVRLGYTLGPFAALRYAVATSSFWSAIVSTV
jgi:hypothetical protein